MDQKKIFWIIAAVGTFLLVVLGAALIMYAPEKKQASLASAPVERKADNYSTGWTNTPDLNAPGSQQIPLPPQPVQPGNSTNTQEMIVFSDNTTVLDSSDKEASDSTTIDLNTLKQQMLLDQYAQQNQNPQNINITVNLPETSVNLNQTEQKVVTSDYYVAAQNDSSAPSKAPAPAAEKPAPSAKTPETKKEPVQSKAVTTTSKTTTVTTTVNTPKAVTQYWVQVAAYTNKKGAENARSVLDENKIPADVFTYEDNKSKLYYRVRVGPYTTKSEAEYWRSKIIKINEFSKAESFITSTTN